MTSSSRAPVQIAPHADDLARATRRYADLLGRDSEGNLVGLVEQRATA